MGNTPTKLQTFVELLESKHSKEACQVFMDLHHLTADDKHSLIQALRGRKIPVPKNGEIHSFAVSQQLQDLGITHMVLSEDDWLDGNFVEQFVETIVVSRESLEYNATHVFSSEEDPHTALDVEFDHNMVLLSFLDGGDTFFGTPLGGFVDWTPKTSYEPSLGIVRNLHFVVRPLLGDDEAMELDARLNVYTQVFDASVQINARGQITQMFDRVPAGDIY